ncbi:MAG: universal stress protein [Solirubrobacteraceae bacterium]
MRAVIWITESTWEACVDRARQLVPGDAELTLLHVAPTDVEDVAARGAARLLGRRPPPPPGPPLRAIAAEEAQALLESAQSRLGRAAQLDSRRGRVEREVVEACAGADLLVVTRDGEPRVGPKSLGPHTRFVVDHAPCQVLLVWPGEPAAGPPGPDRRHGSPRPV